MLLFILWFNNNNCKFVITDVRFQNEAEFIKKYGGILIEIDRNTGIIDEHISENNIIICDYKINNNSTLISLYKNIDKIISSQ